MWLVFLPLALLTLVEQIVWFTIITSKHLRFATTLLSEAMYPLPDNLLIFI